MSDFEYDPIPPKPVGSIKVRFVDLQEQLAERDATIKQLRKAGDACAEQLEAAEQRIAALGGALRTIHSIVAGE